MNATKRWKTGDRYWMAEGTLNGRDQDLHEQGEFCETKDDAILNALRWLSSLSDRERKYAEAWASEWQVDDLDDDGTVGAAHNTGSVEHVAAD